MDINEFCAAKDDPREFMREPFSLNSRTVATTGYALLSISSDEERNECPDDKRSIIEDVLNRLHKRSFIPIPAHTYPEKEACVSCGGSKKARKENCEECDGEGEVDAETDYNTYHGMECKTCNGEGVTIWTGGDEDCPDCNAAGEVYPRGSMVDIGGVLINPSYLSLIVNEEGLMVSPSPEEHMLYFKAGDSEGVILGIHP